MSYIKLTKSLNIDDIINWKISKKDAYKIFINDTIFEPIEILLKENNTDYHFLILISILSFFEPHGRFLWEISWSKNKFKLWFKAFLSFLKETDSEVLSELFYKNVRCWLFHSMNMEWILIDSIGFNNTLISTFWNKYIVNVNIFYKELKKYLEEYINNSNENNFDKVFDELILNKLKN